MKPRQQLYEEACERNVRMALPGIKYGTIKGLEAAKHSLGIRQLDTKYDAKILTRIQPVGVLA
jgi:hypothetical protein